MERTPFISIVIPVRNRAALLRACLKSIGEIDYPRDRFEVIIVDGDSTDGSADIAKKWGAIVLQDPWGSIAQGINIGFANSKGSLIAFCDSDCVVDRDWLKAALPYFKDRHVGGVGGPIFAPEQGVFAQSVHLFFQFAVIMASAAHSSTPGPVREVRHIPTCNFIVRREALEHVLPFAWPLRAGNDLELTRCIRQKGFRLLLTPNVRVWHYNRKNFRSFIKQLSLYGVANAYIGRRDRSLTRLPHILAGLSIPLAIAMFASLIVFPSLLPVAGAACVVASLGFGAWAFYRSRSLAIAVCSVPTLIVGVLAWSSGFIFERARSLLPGMAPAIRFEPSVS